MAMKKANSPDEIDWLCPELLTKDGLVYILQQRYTNEENLEEMEKEDLLKLYYKYIIPLPQRQYRKNRRGRDMTKKQIMMAKKRRIEAPSEDEPPKKKQSMSGVSDPSSRFLTSFTDPSKLQGDRLKPPPSCIDPKRKTIKLGSGTKPVSPTSPDLPTSPTKIVKITMDESPSVNHTIKLINKHLLTKTEEKSNSEENGDVEMKDFEKSENTTKTDEDAPKKRPKLKRISWP